MLKQNKKNRAHLGQHVIPVWLTIPKGIWFLIIWSGLLILGYFSGKYIWY